MYEGAHGYGGIRVWRSVFLALQAGHTIQDFNFLDPVLNGDARWSYRTSTLGFGPVIAVKAGKRLGVLGGIHQVWLKSAWAAPRFARCQGAFCPHGTYPLGGRPVGTDQGVDASVALVWQLFREGESEIPFGFGLRGRLLAAPRTAENRIPVSQWGVFLVIYGGEI
jgi:hypothetical protein